jgi:hypothetical protein
MLADWDTETPDDIMRFFSRIITTMTMAVKKNCKGDNT